MSIPRGRKTIAPVLPPEPLAGNATMRAFERTLRDPLFVASISQFENVEHAVSLCRAMFMEGARYATERCKSEGHVKP